MDQAGRITAVQEHEIQGRSWGQVAIPLLTSGHLPVIPEWREAWLEGFLEGVTKYVKELKDQPLPQ